MRRVVITGMGIVSSIGDTVLEVLESLKSARSGITFSPSFSEHRFRSQVEGRPALRVEEHVDRRAMRFNGQGTGWLHVAMEEALKSSGLDLDRIAQSDTGVVVGSGGASTRTIVDSVNTALSKDPKKIGPFAVPKSMSSSPSATLGTWFKLKGVNYSISSACATSNHCIGHAYDLIRSGRQRIVFAGGCEDLDWTLAVLFDAMGAMSTKYNATPERASRSFDRNRDGFVIAGGAGVVVLEERSQALARNAPIYGEIVGYGATSDGYDMVSPSGEGAVRCMKQSLEGIDLSLIDYINPHATSTVVGEQKEVEAIREVFASQKRLPLISSTKSLTGHSLGATGVQELIYTLLMMKHRFICKSAHIEELDPEFAGLPIAMQRKDNMDIRYALSNSFGFGGTNASLVIKNCEL